MVEPPSKTLLEALLTLKLCTRRDLFRCRGRVRRLARDLPAFDSVWIDSLLHARKLTPFQARLLERGDYEGLSVGPCVLISRLGNGSPPRTFLARQRNGSQRIVLKQVDLPAEQIAPTLARLEQLVESLQGFAHAGVAVPHAALRHNQQVVVLSRFVSGPHLAELLVRRGRFPAGIVLDIGRHLVDALAALEEAGIIHGDIRLEQIRLTASGHAVLVEPGIAAAISPIFSIHTQLAPKRCDGIAPERIGTGESPSHRSDIYSLGCLLWQLLAGRPPYPTNDPLAKLASHQTREIADVRKWAPDTPAPLAEAIHAFTHHDPRCRPQSFREIRQKWGPPRRQSRRRLAGFRAMFKTAAPRLPIVVSQEARSRWPMTIALIIAVVGAGFLFLDHRTRNHLLSWGQTASRATEVADSDPVTRPQGSSPVRTGLRLRPLPEPEAAGVITLASGGPFQAKSLTQVGPLTIRGNPEAEPIVVVSESSWRLVAEKVTLENVHVRKRDDESPGGDNRFELLNVQSQDLVVRSCSFETGQPGRTPNARSAVVWTPVDGQDASGGRLMFQNTVFAGDATAVLLWRCPRLLRLHNCLKVGEGPLLACGSAPEPGTGLAIEAQQLTLRRAAPLLWMRAPDKADAAGSIMVRAADCLFEPAGPAGALFRFESRLPSPRSLRHFEMTGSGTVIQLADETRLVDWLNSATREKAGIDPAAFNLEGYVIGSFEYAGPLSANPADSAVRSLNAPRRSEKPPGIDAALLRFPR